MTWQWLRVRRRGKVPFVTIHAPPHSATLQKRDDRKTEPATSLVQLVRDKVPALGPDAKFDGVWWLPGGHAQTIYSTIGNFSKVDPVVYERRPWCFRVFLQLPDKGIVAVDVAPPLASHPISGSEDVLLVAHGLTGGSHEAYVRAVLARVTRNRDAGGLGLRAVVLNFRGCNGSPLVTPRLYHAGSSDDIRHVVLWICHTFPECRIYGLGFSLGGNILTKYAGEEGDACPLQGLVTLANPWDFVEGSRHMLRSPSCRYVYRYALGGALRQLLYVHRKVFLDAAKLPLSRHLVEDVLRWPSITLGQYDTFVQAPMFGFKSSTDYYAYCTSSRLAPDIRVPLLAINSTDDPVVSTTSLPFDQIPNSPWLVLAVTQTGGHLGWYERGTDGRISRWFVEPVAQFLAALMEYGTEDRRKPRCVDDGAGFVRDSQRDDVGFRQLSLEESELVVSGAGESKLFTGW
ncbi:AB-hydrolase YheT [Cubamyces sp. BRFM 1775]|nr:AB-hydrolase YheT [Cubamyces sp. BRFM 1775]